MTKYRSSLSACTALILLGVGVTPSANAAYSFTDLGTLGGTFIGANVISSTGQVTVASSWIGSTFRATPWEWMNNYQVWVANRKQFLYPENWLEPELHTVYTISLLGNLGGTFSSTYTINNIERVTGWALNAGNTATHATLWNGSAAIDLNSLLDAGTVNAGWELTMAWGINDKSWIVGDAYNRFTDQYHGFLLSEIPDPAAAVPEPEIYAMLLAGLGLLGFTARHRKIFAV
jgi:PEP-CTERM motif